MQKCAVTAKNVYGVEVFYPANQEAKIFCELLGQKTLTPRDIKLIQRLGYQVENQPDEIKF